MPPGVLPTAEQAAHLAARVPVAGRRAGPGGGPVGHDRVGGAGRRGRRRRRWSSRRRGARPRPGRSRESWSISRSRRSIRSFGLSPRVKNCEIVLFRSASSVAILAISPPGPAIAVVLALRAASWAATICERTEWIESVRPLALLDERLLGGLRRPAPWRGPTRSSRTSASCALMPFSPGSASESSALSSASACARPLVDVRVLGAVLRVQELVADAAEALDVDAGAELRAGRCVPSEIVSARARRPACLLARVALGGGVRDVVAGGVEHALLGQKAAQGGLHAVERGDGHQVVRVGLGLEVQGAVGGRRGGAVRACRALGGL